MKEPGQNINYPFPLTQKVIWGDMDAFNHVNNVIFFRYFENGRVEFFNKTKLWETYFEENIKIVVGKLECNYIKQVVHPATIEISVGIKKIGNSSLTVHHKVSSNGEVVAHGDGIIVATDPVTGKSTPWTEKLRAEFLKWL